MTRKLATLVLVALAGAALAADTPDAKLPFNPLAGAKDGDWAQYRVADPAKPDERLPGELYVVESVKDGVVNVVSTQRESFKFKAGEEGLSAAAYLRGFFGEARDAQLSDLRDLEVTPDPVEVGGKRYDAAVRIDAKLSSALKAEEAKGKPAEVTRTLSVWVAPGVRALGAVKAEARIEVLGEVHRGTLTLAAHGVAGEKPPSLAAPQGATGTAQPPPR